MTLMLDRLSTAARLGPGNIVRMLRYRLEKRAGLYRRLLPLPSDSTYAAPFAPAGGEQPDDRFAEAMLFGRQPYDLRISESWTSNVLTSGVWPTLGAHWSSAQDFDGSVGDIKGVWELSRFDWLLRLAWLSRMGSPSARETAERLLFGWVRANPANSAPNWMCAQECSIRLMHVLFAQDVLAPSEPLLLGKSGLGQFVATHLRRVLPTLHYAMAQDNNHATSEAAALFCGGLWLGRRPGDLVRGDAEMSIKCVRKGRRLLERSVARLVAEDGTFAQQSVVYQRLFVDSMVFVELQRRKCRSKRFSNSFYEKMQLAARWLLEMTDLVSGDAPNAGTNDGARLFNATGGEFRDFASSGKLACAVFGATGQSLQQSHPMAKVYPEFLHDAAISEATESVGPATTCTAPGGFVRIDRSDGWAMLRLPGYRFRPSQSDALHVDVWHRGRNVLRDAGTYSYFDPAGLQFAGCAFHNTVCFDDRDQMPRLGRFLFGSWLTRDATAIDRTAGSAKSGYTDHCGSVHARTVIRTPDGWTIVDEIGGPFTRATLSWRVDPERDWQLDGSVLHAEGVEIHLEASPVDVQLESTWESRYYNVKSKLPRLQAYFDKPARHTTRIRLT